MFERTIPLAQPFKGFPLLSAAFGAWSFAWLAQALLTLSPPPSYSSVSFLTSDVDIGVKLAAAKSRKRSAI